MDMDDQEQVLYTWARNGALTFTVQSKSKKTSIRRTYFSMCKLMSKSKHQTYYVLALLRTLCCRPIYNFLVWNENTGLTEMWDQEEILDYWCVPSHIVDVDKLLEARHTHFDRSKWYYNPKRRVPIDTKNAGNFDRQYESTDEVVKQSYIKWKQNPGKRNIENIVDEVGKRARRVSAKVQTLQENNEENQQKENKNKESDKMLQLELKKSQKMVERLKSEKKQKEKKEAIQKEKEKAKKEAIRQQNMREKEKEKDDEKMRQQKLKENEMKSKQKSKKAPGRPSTRSKMTTVESDNEDFMDDSSSNVESVPETRPQQHQR
jgi:hypothetical protein